MAVDDGTGGRLATFAVFRGLPEAALAALSRAAVRRRWPPGAAIFQRGDPGDHLLAITRGRVRLALATAQGREVVLKHAGPGEVIGEVAIVDGSPRSADATAVDETEALLLARAPFLAAAHANPAIFEALARHLCGLLRDTNFQMESIALYDLQSRLARFLLFTLEQQHGGDPPARASLRLPLSQSELSAILGASRPKVNQVLQALLASGTLTRQDDDRFACRTDDLRGLADPD